MGHKDAFTKSALSTNLQARNAVGRHLPRESSWARRSSSTEQGSQRNRDSHRKPSVRAFCAQGVPMQNLGHSAAMNFTEHRDTSTISACEADPSGGDVWTTCVWFGHAPHLDTTRFSKMGAAPRYSAQEKQRCGPVGSTRRQPGTRTEKIFEFRTSATIATVEGSSASMLRVATWDCRR